jgi:murein DD-endopeptidase MepM/ murein hydrolase activator NlpD
VTAVAEGLTTITATSEGVGGSATVSVGTGSKLIWPIDCVPGETCSDYIGYPDIDQDGRAFNCGAPGYKGHQGTDINITWEQMDAGVDVLAAAAGQVLWVFDGKYDRCPNATETDCQPPNSSLQPGLISGHTVCTGSGNYCGTGSCCCFWCFAGGNLVVIRHTGIPGVFATRYDHLKKNSIVVAPGEIVQQGQKIAEAGSAGNSSGPHLHFEVWGSGFYELADPWAGPCGPNTNNPLWAFDPPWQSRRRGCDDCCRAVRFKATPAPGRT